MTPQRFDALDYKILTFLQRDARCSAADIARALQANERTIRKRIDRLTRSGAVRLTAIVDPAAFGYVETADIFLEVQPEFEEAALAQLMQMPNISYVAFGQGTNDVSIEGRFRSNDEMRRFLRHTLPGIAGVQVKGYALVPRILRNIDEWMPAAEDFAVETQDQD
ncbi:MAG: Lrp/AsnC family transcriptional regulator [Longilinea sp.]|nr:Lrp/AsnC family transcriptional regulator [Longilinea sp.]